MFPEGEKLLKDAILLVGKEIKNYEAVRSTEQLQEIVDSNKEVIDSIHEKAAGFNPDTEPELNRFPVYDAGNNVKIYKLEDSTAAQEAVRRAINANWGKDASPWCLAKGDGKGHLAPVARTYWKRYSSYPKRIAFKNGKLLAFCASDDKKLKWWDRKDNEYEKIPFTPKAKDDPEFIKNYCSATYVLYIYDKDELRKFAKHKDEVIRAGVAKNPNLDESILEILAKDKSDIVKKP